MKRVLIQLFVAFALSGIGNICCNDSFIAGYFVGIITLATTTLIGYELDKRGIK